MASKATCRTPTQTEVEHKLNLVAACAFGLEAVVKRELIVLGYDAKVAQPGRVQFEGVWPDVCRANLWLRTADRVLIQALQFDAPDFEALFETVKAFDWSCFIPANAEFPVTGRSRLSKLTSVPAVQRSVKRALVESLRKHHGVVTLDETGPKFSVDVALLNDVATLTIDTTGDSLHKRGYRKLTGKAPIKETLAAALVDLSVWNSARTLADPFCGTGTIAIEAALQGLNIAPSLEREFASSSWPQVGEAIWAAARDEARSTIDRQTKLAIFASDIDAEALSMAAYHAKRAGVDRQIRFDNRAFASFENPAEYGCLITNPPYGQRLEDQRQLQPLYESFPAVLQKLPTWSFFLLSSLPGVERIFHKQATRRRKLFNGRIECTYYQYLGPRPPKDFLSTPVAIEYQATCPEVDRSSAESSNAIQTKPVFGGLEPKDREQAELFRSRLLKRARHLRRWPSRRGITCFRLYERDIPEIPLVVDRYEDHLQISEYERPHDRDPARHRQWLELMQQTAADALDVPFEQTHLKFRDRENRQYEKVHHQRQLIEVHEGGLNFLVNLTDYMDTGLFLDHRQTRQMVRDEADGKRFLNLFAYTGSFTVYAAAGGAVTSTSVDLSKNYLDWAQRNLRANRLAGPQHDFFVEDTIEFLKQAAANVQRYDLCVVDPPTFSNSKQTDRDWDVQSQHVELLNRIAQVMTSTGVVYFSTNFRRFRFDQAELDGYNEVREISKQTVPEDFRNKRIHRCWRLVSA